MFDEDQPFSAVRIATNLRTLERGIPAWAWVATILLGLLMVVLFVIGFACLLLATSVAGPVQFVPVALLCFGLIIPVSLAGDQLNSIETWLRRARRRDYCPMCRYDMRHLPSKRCPECAFNVAKLEFQQAPDGGEGTDVRKDGAA